jgi:hypothetical protein
MVKRRFNEKFDFAMIPAGAVLLATVKDRTSTFEKIASLKITVGGFWRKVFRGDSLHGVWGGFWGGMFGSLFGSTREILLRGECARVRACAGIRAGRRRGRADRPQGQWTRGVADG